MADSSEAKAYHIVSVSGGYQLAHRPIPPNRKHYIGVQDADATDKAQQWSIEYGDKPDVIALRCCSNGQYLRTDTGNNWAVPYTGEKQWWKVDRGGPVLPLMGCRLSPVDFPKAFLNHFEGHPINNENVHMWEWWASTLQCPS